MGIVQEMIDKQVMLERNLGTYHAHCDEVAKYVIPRLDTFFRSNTTTGEKRGQNMFDSTAPLALERFASIIESLICPRGQLWHGLGPEDEELENDHEAMLWYEKVRNALFKLRYGSESNFAPQLNEVFSSMGAFGTGVLITEERPGSWLRYKSSHVKEHFFQENSDGIIDANWRKYYLTARQAMQLFGQVADKIEQAAEKEPTRKFPFLHCVFPNTERVYGAVGPRGMGWTSMHIDIENKMMMAPPGGYRKFPFIIARYTTSPDEIMGRSVAMTALPEIKTLNQKAKTDLRARHLAVTPPILASSEASVRKFNMQPEALNYGTLDMAGNPLVRPFMSGGHTELSTEGIEQSRRMINDIFLVTLFQVLIQTPEMTATEVLARQQEKGDLLSPVGGRLENEFCSKLIDREIDAMAAAGQFDSDGPLPMPDSVRERGGAYSVQYLSPMSRLRVSGEAAGAERTIQAMIPIAQIDPTIWETVNFEEYAKVIAKASGAPIRIMNSPEKVAELRQQRAQQQQMAQLAQAGPALAGSIKDLAQAQAASQ